jgi:tetratricopeptide (TPR) repeat protein
MRWLEPEFNFNTSPTIAISVLSKAIEKQPNKPALHARLAEAFMRCGRFSDAADAYEIAARQALGDFLAWPKLAMCYLELDRPEDALDTCRRGESPEPSAAIQFQRGCALRKLGRLGEAQDAFLSAITINTHLDALKALLKPLAQQSDGRELLDFCDALPRSYQGDPLVLANRAIALSRLGRTEEALQIVDLDRHVARTSFAPPAQFAGIEQFNRQLADDILADRPAGTPDGKDCDINYAPRFDQSQALLLLRDFIKSAIDIYLDEFHDRKLDAVMPPPPAAGTLFASSVVLRAGGRNGEHVHPGGYLSAVYHVLVPDSVTQASDNRGSLVLGRCDRYTGGYVPCWGSRYVKPIAGSLVIFPSHFYHDVAPSQTWAPRISVAADLRPVAV